MIKSPIFYMGNKFDLLENLIRNFPKENEVNEFIDLFGGSGVVSINVPYKKVIYNELNNNIYELFKTISSVEPEKIINHIEKRIVEFNLYNKTTDTRQISDIKIREEASVKYNNFRSFYNSQIEKDYLDLFTLIFFSFSNLIRFNNKKEFNMPFGNRCFIKGEHDINIHLFHQNIKNKNITILNKNAFDILSEIKENKGQFIYLDPPYSNTLAIYNEQRAGGGWNINDDIKLFNELDRLNKLGIKWAMSNVLENKGNKNEHIEQWSIKNNYKIVDFNEKEYSALGKGNAKTREVLIINYKPNFEIYNIFDFMGGILE